MNELTNGLQCGICSKTPHIDAFTRENNQNKFYCPSCIHFKLLKYKLSMLNLEYFDANASAEIDKVLDNCIGGNAPSFLSEYLEDNETSSSQVSSTSSKTKKSSRDKHKLTPSIDSVARLSHMLLNVEIMKHKKELNILKAKVLENSRRNLIVSEKVKQMEGQIHSQKQHLGNTKALIRTQYQDKLKELKDTTENIENVKLNSVERHLNSTKKRMLRSIFKALDVIIVDSESIKVQPAFKDSIKLSLIVQFTPIIPVSDFIKYSPKLINESLEKVGCFLNAVSSLWQIQLPFTLIRKSQLGVLTHDESIKYTSFLLNNPATCEYFPLQLCSKNGPPDNLESIVDLSGLELNRLNKALSRLLIDIVVVSKAVGVDISLSEMKFGDLLQIDKLLLDIVTSASGGFKESEAKVSDPVNKPTKINEKAPRRKSFLFMSFWGKPKEKKTILDINEEKKQPESQVEVQEDELKVKQDPLQHVYEYMNSEIVDLTSRRSTCNLLSSSASSSSVFQVSTMFTSPALSSDISVEDLLNDVDKFSHKFEEFFKAEAQKLLEKNGMTNTMNTMESSSFQPVIAPSTMSVVSASFNSVQSSPRLNPQSRNPSINNFKHIGRESSNSPSLAVTNEGWKKNQRSMIKHKLSNNRLPKAGQSKTNKNLNLDNWEFV
ncbi:unnamed protein product [Ambrosiozyma monospora]|uniref:Unnamed protein product n=1 Tax=Ambrosiozyma monospora TaxID=43982 RepID=A0A9W6YQY9_AMBMO|nr:unnamed protein product [Ambrosiozyma monospora]